MLTQAQIDQYQEDGYLVLRNQFDQTELAKLDSAFQQSSPEAPGLAYPEPGRYTLAKSAWAHSGFVQFAEHPTVLNGAKTLLNDDVYLSAYVLYDRTPDGPPIPQHHDYKRWRPVGSSLNWLFTIIPMCNFDEDTGQLFVAPGSHRLERVADRGEGALHVDAAISPKNEDFVDPELKRGDLLFMNMHLWHKAAGNTSELHRVGLFNKYAARHYPPATGYYVYSDEIYDLFSESGKDIIAVHSDKPVATTRLLLQRERKGAKEFFFQKNGDKLCLPGGETWDEQAIPDWDLGNYVDACLAGVRKTIKVEPPWVSYVGDYDEDQHLCRVYAYPMNNNGFPVPYQDGQWLAASQMEGARLQFGYEKTVIEDWLDPSMVRSKAISQAKARIDQFAY
jgi:hypothetical protein